MAMKIRDDRQMRALTGLSQKKMKVILPVFEETYKRNQQRAYEEAVKKGKRLRKPGGGRPSKLKTMRAKLEFVLRYLKTYPTYDELAESYDMARSSVHDNVKALVPLLEETLATLGVLPKRRFESVEAFREYCQHLDLETLLIDVTERPCRRHQDNDKQKEHYSGKKKTTPYKT